MVKRAIITAIYKKDYFNDPVNYRSIWIITSFSNLLEKSLHRKIKNYIESWKVKSMIQFGIKRMISAQGLFHFSLSQSKID